MKLWMYRLRIYNRRGECAGQSVGLIQAETEEKARAALAEDMGDNACIANIWEPTIRAPLQYKCNRKNKKSDSEGVPC